MFEKIFKFSGEQFRAGEVRLELADGIFLPLLILVVLALLVSLAYSFARVYHDRRVRWVSLSLRLLAVLLLCVPLFEPVLVTADVVPDENFVAVLVDNSASMSIPDEREGRTRYDEARRLVDGGLAGELREHFQLRYYAFDTDARRVDSLGVNAQKGERTRLASALDRVVADFRGVPLAGVVLLTDGGDNGEALPVNSANALVAAGVPLHVIGLGSEEFAGEREILDVNVTRGVERNTGAEIDVKVRSWARESAPVELAIYRGDERVFTEQRTLKGEGRVDQFSLFFEPPDPGATEYRLVLEASEGEFNTENNELEMMVDTRSDTTRVLYFEGALRQDFKFIKRALEDDQVVDFVSVSRTGTGKYYRQGISSPSELAGGFPASEAELFDFDAIVFGDIEASAFTLEQQRMLEKFVRVRGGGFLMLGGLSAFAEGDYWNTPIAEVLPVGIDPDRRRYVPDLYAKPDAEPIEQGFRFLPTAVGLDNPALKLSADPQTNRTLWGSMPGLTSLNLLGAPKPGATVLAAKPADDFGESEPILITQRYGRGRGTALATSSTWRWQMLLDADDFRHERFWRQLVRWQSAEAPDMLNIHADVETPAPGQEIVISVDAFQPDFQPLARATVTGVVVDPTGAEETFVLREDVVTDGTYAGTFTPRVEGIHTIAVAVVGEGTDESATATRSMLVRPSRTEFYDATLKSAALKEIATLSGGYYYEPDESAVIPDRIRMRRTHTSIYRSEYLWDAPFWLGLAMLLLCAEWFYRRRKGMP